MSGDTVIEVLDTVGKDAEEPNQKVYPPDFQKELEEDPVGSPGQVPVVVLSGSFGVPHNWRICAFQCVLAWFVYHCRSGRPSDRGDLQNTIQNIMETIDRVLNSQISHERAIMELLILVYSRDPTNGLKFELPNSFQDALVAVLTMGMPANNLLIEIGRRFTPCDEDGSGCTAPECAAEQQQHRTHFSNSLWSSSELVWTKEMSVNDLVNRKLEQSPKKRYRDSCAVCGQPTDWLPVFDSFIYIPSYLLVPCFNHYDQSQKTTTDFLIGDEVTVPAFRSGVALYDVSAVSYISKEGGTTDKHIIIIMRGNEDPAQLYMYDSRTAGGAFVALRGGAFPFLYVSSYGWNFYAQDIILKHRCMRGAAGGAAAADV